MYKSKLLLVFLTLSLLGNVLKGQDSLFNFNNKWSTELNFNPFNGNLDLNNASGQIKFRYFQPNRTAWRFAVNLNYKQNNNSEESLYGTSPYKNSSRQKSTTIGLNIGKEKHFDGTKRLSPYIGWEMALGFKSSYQKISTKNSSIEIEGSWVKYVQEYSSQYPNQYYTTQVFEERGYWSVGANLIGGFDFYVSQKFYLGYEILFGLDYKGYKDIDITEKYTNSQTTPESYPDHKDESWSFGPRLTNGIRLGFVF